MAVVSGDQQRSTAGDQGMAHPARMYDYWLGGKDNFAVDRAVADRVLANAPVLPAACRENRHFLRRAVEVVARLGVDQFVDIGAGFPTMGNTNEIAHAVNPEARVVYVDNDEVVLAHGRALLAKPDGGRTAMLEGDVRKPEQVFNDPALLAAVDLERPVAVLLLAILHFISDDDDPAGIVARVFDLVAPGSYLILSHATYDFDLKVLNNSRVYNDATVPFVPRSKAQIQAQFAGFELVDPGLAEIQDWRPDGTRVTSVPHAYMYGGVAVKP